MLLAQAEMDFCGTEVGTEGNTSGFKGFKSGAKSGELFREGFWLLLGGLGFRLLFCFFLEQFLGKASWAEFRFIPSLQPLGMAVAPNFEYPEFGSDAR